jgi:hypothetical protein
MGVDNAGYGSTSSHFTFRATTPRPFERARVSSGQDELGRGADGATGTELEMTETDDVELANVAQPNGCDGAEEADVCRICHDDLTDTARGQAVVLQCGCKGALSVAHRRCALRWFRSRGDSTCEVCNEDTELNLAPDDGERAGVTRRTRRPPGPNGGSLSRGARGGDEFPGEDVGDRDGGDDETGEDESLSDSDSDSDALEPHDSGDAPGDSSDAVARRARQRETTRARRRRRARRRWWRCCCGPILPSAAPEPTYDMETGERLPDVATGGCAISDLLVLICAIFASQTLLLMSRPGDASHPAGLPIGLAVALAYMNTGAHLLGLVQLLVGLSVGRLGRWTQVCLLWVWAGAIGVGSWGLFRRFIDGAKTSRSRGGSSSGEGALVACVIVCVAAAASPTFFFCWISLSREWVECMRSLRRRL